MNPLTEINDYITEDFNNEFEDIQEWLDGMDLEDQPRTAEEAVELFDREFDERYNSELEYLDYYEINRMATNFNKSVMMIRFLLEKYQEFGFDVEAHFFQTDLLLKRYVIFYLEEEVKSQHIDSLEAYYAEKQINPQEGGSEDEAESEDEA